MEQNIKRRLEAINFIRRHGAINEYKKMTFRDLLDMKIKVIAGYRLFVTMGDSKTVKGSNYIIEGELTPEQIIQIIQHSNTSVLYEMIPTCEKKYYQVYIADKRCNGGYNIYPTTI